MDKNLTIARGLYYNLFSEIFAFLSEPKQFSSIKEKVEYLSLNPLEENSQKSLQNMKSFLEKGYDALKNEQDSVFYDIQSSFVPVTASFYDEERDDGKKRLEMIHLMQEAKVKRDESCKDSEDSIWIIFSFMNTLLQSASQNDKKSEKLSDAVFKNLINNFADEFVIHLVSHENGDFYKSAGELLSIFIEFERMLLNVERPKIKFETENQKINYVKERKPTIQRPKKNLDELSSL